MLEVKLDRARKGWDWEIYVEGGIVLAHGRQKTRIAAKYQAERALFQLLTTGWKRDNNAAEFVTLGKPSRYKAGGQTHKTRSRRQKENPP